MNISSQCIPRVDDLVSRLIIRADLADLIPETLFETGGVTCPVANVILKTCNLRSFKYTGYKKNC